MDITTRHIHARTDTDCIVIELLDRRILEHAHLQALNHELLQIARRAPGRHVIIDFRRVEHFSSAMLSVLVAFLSRLQKIGRELRLAGISTELRSIFRMTKLHHVFAMHEDSDSARDSLPRPLADSA